MRWSLPLLLMLASLLLPVQARTLQMQATRVQAPVAELQQVRLRLHWPDGASHGTLELRAARLRSESLGYQWRDVTWQCPLRRERAGGWHCEGEIRSAGQRPARLAIRLHDDGMQGSLTRGDVRVDVVRDNRQPELTRIDLARVPAAWLQALARKAWTDVQLQRGQVDGRLRVHAPAQRPLRVEGHVQVAGLALQNNDASIASDNLDARLQLDYLAVPAAEQIRVEGQLVGGEFLAGNAYLALPATPVQLAVQARRDGSGWALPSIQWRDEGVLHAQGSARLGADARLDALRLQVDSHDMQPLRERYLSGWLGAVGLGDVQLRGRSRAELHLADGRLQWAEAELAGVDLVDPRGRFGFGGLAGDIRFSAAGPVSSRLQWNAARLHGLEFGAADLPIASAHGALRLDETVDIPLFGGIFRIDGLTLRPPAGDTGLHAEFALQLEDVDFGRVSEALGLPAFVGTLHGFLPHAVYADDVLVFDGGLSMALFDGIVQFSDLSLERPFGIAPSLSADIDLRGIDLDALTGVLDIGGVTGRMDGRVHGLRLVDWTPVAFDAWLQTVPRAGVRQRISQRAVQDISSVGDASFVGSLQGRLIGLFDDFGYRRIGIGCRLANEVCEMSGLRSDDNSFTIVEGAGLPRLDVVGHHRRVDWPTLVERLAAVGKGEVSPVIE